MSTDLIVESRGSVIQVEINRPPANRFSRDMCHDLTQVLTAPPDGARVLVLSAAGPSFCLGRDRTAVSPADAHAMARDLARLNEAIVRSSLAVVAQVAGDAAGFGVGLVALSDVTIAATTAKFWFPEVEAGLAPALVLTWLPAALGRRHAFWLTATGQPLTAQAAQQAGLINQAVGPTELAATVTDAVEMLLRQPPQVCPEIKRDLLAFAAAGLGDAADRAVDRLTLRALSLDGRSSG
jgi:methylglutaconyl-CoA hydratase